MLASRLSTSKANLTPGYLPCGGAKAVFLKGSWVDYSSNRVDKVDYPRVEYCLTVMDE